MQMDIIIFHFFNNLAGLVPWLDGIFLFIADWMDLSLIVIAIIFLLFFDDHLELKYFSKKELYIRIKRMIFIFLTSISAWIVAKTIKEIIVRPRPFLTLDNVNLLLQHGNLDSFPSGHGTFFMALAVSMYFINKRIGIYFGFGAILIGLSRIIVGIHYPSDVFFGFILGGLVSFFIFRSFKILKRMFFC